MIPLSCSQPYLAFPQSSLVASTVWLAVVFFNLFLKLTASRSHAMFICVFLVFAILQRTALFRPRLKEIFVAPHSHLRVCLAVSMGLRCDHTCATSPVFYLFVPLVQQYLSECQGLSGVNPFFVGYFSPPDPRVKVARRE